MPEPDRQTDELWDVADVARYLGVSVPTVRNYMRVAGLPFRRVGRLIRFIPEEVRSWVASRTAA